MTKVIISHDVDHISSSEHWGDLIVPKFFVRSCIEYMKGMLTIEQLYQRIYETIEGRWSFIGELAEFDRLMNINATYFFATGAGLGLRYTPIQAKSGFDKVILEGHSVGIHGVARNNIEKMRHEKEKFENFYGVNCSGIRLHYLYPDSGILNKMHALGYQYDSSLRGSGDAYVSDSGIVHFPVHIMDCDVFNQGGHFQSLHLQKALQMTKQSLDEHLAVGTNYVSIIFHDRYFSTAHSVWRDWYMELLDWITSQHINTCTYDEATHNLLL